MIKRCERCGEEYKITGGLIGVPESGKEIEISDISLCLSFTDLTGKKHYQDFDFCPDCMEEIFKVMEPGIETETNTIKGGLS